MSYSPSASALVVCVLFSSTLLHAQTTGGTSNAPRQLPAIWVGAGLSAGNGDANSAVLATAVGGMVMGAIELPMRQTFGPASVALRAEGRWAQQSIEVMSGSGMSGDVQTVSTGLTLRAFPVKSPAAARPRITPYVLTGVGMARVSTRVAVSISDPDMPTARFSQTSSELAPTALGGVGALLRLGRAQLFGEARTEFARRDAGTLRGSFGTIGIVFQPQR